MAFEKQAPVTSVSIGAIQVILYDPNPTTVGDPSIPGGGVQSATALIQVIMSDGTSREVRANIPNHFSTTVVNQLKNFVASVRTKANSEILGA
jgi:hypothetical protein